MTAKHPNTGAKAGGAALYVYCIGELNTLAPLLEGALPPAIESSGAIELIVNDDLAAITSQVPLAEYNEETLRDRLRDSTWMAVRAMRHEKVVEYFASRAAVVPLRFGAIYLHRDNVKTMLEEEADRLRRTIDRLAGHQ